MPCTIGSAEFQRGENQERRGWSRSWDPREFGWNDSQSIVALTERKEKREGPRGTRKTAIDIPGPKSAFCTPGDQSWTTAGLSTHFSAMMTTKGREGGGRP